MLLYQACGVLSHVLIQRGAGDTVMLAPRLRRSDDLSRHRSIRGRVPARCLHFEPEAERSERLPNKSAILIARRALASEATTSMSSCPRDRWTSRRTSADETWGRLPCRLGQRLIVAGPNTSHSRSIQVSSARLSHADSEWTLGAVEPREEISDSASDSDSARSDGIRLPTICSTSACRSAIDASPRSSSAFLRRSTCQSRMLTSATPGIAGVGSGSSPKRDWSIVTEPTIGPASNDAGGQTPTKWE